MLCERSVAGFAVDMSVDTFCFGVRFFGMAPFAGLVARKVDGPGGDFGQGVTTEVAIATETFWDECGSEGKEEEQANEKHGSHTEKVRDVLNLNHRAPESTEKLKRTLVQNTRDRTELQGVCHGCR